MRVKKKKGWLSTGYLPVSLLTTFLLLNACQEISPPPCAPPSSGEVLESKGYFNGIIALSFDDDFVEQWHHFNQQGIMHNNKVTFFVCRFEEILESEGLLEKLQELAADGHEIGFHSARHRRPPEAMAAAPEEYMEEQLNVMNLMSSHGFDLENFAFPHGACDNATIEFYGQYFTILRRYKSMKQCYLHDGNWLSNLKPGGGAIGAPIDEEETRPTWGQIRETLAEIASANAIWFPSAHGIADLEAPYKTTPETLEMIFEEGSELGIEFLTFKEVGELFSLD